MYVYHGNSLLNFPLGSPDFLVFFFLKEIKKNRVNSLRISNVYKKGRSKQVIPTRTFCLAGKKKSKNQVIQLFRYRWAYF